MVVVDADVEVGFEFFFGGIVHVLDVADDDAVLQQGDAAADIDGVVEVVAGDDDGGVVFLAILLQQLLEINLVLSRNFLEI